MEKELKFYEKKILNDKEFPIQLHINRVHEKRWYFSPHWHEHIELHYVVSGRTKFLLDQQEIPGEKGDLVIANSNVIHAGGQEYPFSALDQERCGNWADHAPDL